MKRLAVSIKKHPTRWLGVAALALAILLFVLGVPMAHARYTWQLFAQDFYANAITDLLGIALAVLVIDWLNERRQNADKKAELIRDLGSKTYDFAQRAARELSARGWHADGTLENARLTQADLMGANLEGAFLTDAILFGAHQMGANLKGAKLVRADLTGAHLGRVSLTDADVMDAFLTDAFLKSADLTGADLDSANLTDATLTSAILMRANLPGAKLVRANLEDANLEDANLQGANLEDANLQGANLKGAKLVRANLEDADLMFANYSNTTEWPEGFDPQVEGAFTWDEQSFADYLGAAGIDASAQRLTTEADA